MANYDATIRTNYFSVKDEKAFRKLMESVNAEAEIHIFEQEMYDGSKKFGFGCYGAISGICAVSDEDEYPDIDGCIQEALQKLVCEDDAVIMVEIGYEKLRYVTGLGAVITSTEIRHIDVWHESLVAARLLLDNPNFQTQIDY